jgi:Protein of unknown function (DUF688)
MLFIFNWESVIPICAIVTIISECFILPIMQGKINISSRAIFLDKIQPWSSFSSLPALINSLSLVASVPYPHPTPTPMNSSNKKPLHENKIPSKLLTREAISELSNPSFRVYYGKASGSVPFLWESQPGTPKHPSTTTASTKDQHVFPPLTPPPSYFSYSESSSKKKTKSHNLLHIILPKLNLRRLNSSYRSWSSSSCSSSEPSSPAVGQKAWQRRVVTARLSSPKTHFFSNKEEGLHAFMPCFGARR